MTSRAFVLIAALGALLLASGAVAQHEGQPWEDERLFVPPYGQNGCWTLFFAGKEFEPPAARLQGPTFIEKFERGPVVIPELEQVGGPVFLRTVQSRRTARAADRVRGRALRQPLAGAARRLAGGRSHRHRLPPAGCIAESGVRDREGVSRRFSVVDARAWQTRLPTAARRRTAPGQ